MVEKAMIVSTFTRVATMVAAAFAGSCVGAFFRAQAQVVATWESSIANLKSPNVSGQTVRQFARISIGGAQFRIRVSNETGTPPLADAGAHVALPGSIDLSTGHIVTLNGGTTIAVASGAGVISDPVDMPVQPLTRLVVSAFFRSASSIQMGHLLASGINYAAPDDHAAEATMAGGTPTGSGFYLTEILVLVGNLPGGGVARPGDPITDGPDSPPDGEHRWPDRLAERLLASRYGRVGAIDAGLVGNSMLQGPPLELAGPSAVALLPHDVLSRPGVHWPILFEGINDIIYPPDAGDAVAEPIAVYGQVIAQAHEAGVKVFGATLTSWAGSGPAYYSTLKEAQRQRVDTWIRTSAAFDGVFDLDAVVRDPVDPVWLRPAYDGDHLHLNDAGYATIAPSLGLPIAAQQKLHIVSSRSG